MSFRMWWRYVAIRSWLWWISSCCQTKKQQPYPLTRKKNILRNCIQVLAEKPVGTWNCTHLSKEVSDDHVWHSVGPTRDLEQNAPNYIMSEQKSRSLNTTHFKQFAWNFWVHLLLRGNESRPQYLVRRPVHPTLSTWVDVDENTALHHGWVVHLDKRREEKNRELCLL